MILDRQKRWHAKTRNGCLVCRARRIKCDERRPVCQKCEKLGRRCNWAWDPPESNIPRLGVLQTAHSDFLYPSGLHDFDFFVHAGAPLISKWASPMLWCSTLPALSESSVATKFALLALSTTTQLITQNSSDMVKSCTERGDSYYKQACMSVSSSRNTTVEEALAVSISLWNYSFLHSMQIDAFVIHLNAAVKLLHALESDQETPTQKYHSCRSDRQSFARVVRGCLRDIHFPLQNQGFLKMLDRRARRAADVTCKIKIPKPSTWEENPFDELAAPDTINSFFWLIIAADSKQSLRIIHQALDNGAFRSFHDPLPESSAQEVFRNSVLLCSLFCKVHLHDSPGLGLIGKDKLMSDMLDLIQKNMRIWADQVKYEIKEHSAQSFGIGQHGIHCYLGILAFIGNQAYSPPIRFRALIMIGNNGLSET